MAKYIKNARPPLQDIVITDAQGYLWRIKSVGHDNFDIYRWSTYTNDWEFFDNCGIDSVEALLAVSINKWAAF